MKKILFLLAMLPMMWACQNANNGKREIIAGKSEVEKTMYYSIATEEKEFLLNAPEGSKILNQKATNHFGRATYYKIGSLDKVKIIEQKGGWVKVQHSLFEANTGWIEKYKLFEAGSEPNNLDSDISSENPAETLRAGSKGYIRKDCAAAINKNAFDKMCKYLASDNQNAFQELALYGEIIYLKKGDKVNVLENGFGWTRIDYKGKEYYLIQGYLSSRSSGKYINAETGERQDRYGGSQQQKDDLKSIDEYGKNHPEFW